MNAHHRSTRALPDAHEAEEELLGAILLDNAIYWRVAAFLEPQHFDKGTDSARGKLYETFAQMISENRPVTPVTIKPYIDAETVVGHDADGTPVTFLLYVIRLQNADGIRLQAAAGKLGEVSYENGRSIIEMWCRHRLIGIAQDMESIAWNMPAGLTPEKIIGEMSGRLTKVATEGNERAASMKYGVILPNAVDRVAKASADATARIPWFLPEITEALGDMRRGNLIGLMSDSGGGKTSYSLQQCRYAASKGYKSAFFSIEITDEEAALQAAAQEIEVSLGRIDNFTLQRREQDKLEDEMMHSGELPFYIVGFGECTLSDIRIKAEAMVKSHGLDLIIIDHAKMITLPNPKDMFAERINALYRGLKALAKTLNIAIVILIQRNDDWKARFRAGGLLRPVMGDAYGGGSIKQSLDVWFSLYRPEPLYRELIPTMAPERSRDGELTRKQQMILKLEESIGKAWVINHKRRRGEPGKSPCIKFNGEFTRFETMREQKPAGLFGEEDQL